MPSVFGITGSANRLFLKANVNIEGANTLEHLPCFATADGNAQGTLHVAYVEAIAGET